MAAAHYSAAYELEPGADFMLGRTGLGDIDLSFPVVEMKPGGVAEQAEPAARGADQEHQAPAEPGVRRVLQEPPVGGAEAGVERAGLHSF